MEFKLHRVFNVQVKLFESDCKWSPTQILKNLVQNYSTGKQKKTQVILHSGRNRKGDK